MCFGSSENYWSSFAAATLPFPPRLTGLLKDSRKIIKNRRETLVNLNSSIREMNRDEHNPSMPTLLAPWFHTWGIRTRKGKKIVGPRYLLESWLTHRLSEWREHKPKDMLHLGDRARVRMGRSVVIILKLCTGSQCSLLNQRMKDWLWSQLDPNVNTVRWIRNHIIILRYR